MGQEYSTTNTKRNSASESGLMNSQFWILAVVCVPMFFTVLNASAIGVLLPEIARDLSIGTGQVSWLMTGFLLVYGVAIPFFGRIGDIYGAPRLFLIGLVVFTVGSLLSAVAPNYQLLLAARIIQATGGAAIPGLGMAIASRTFPADRQGTVLGVLSATIGVGSAVGPLLGGVMTEVFGWRSIFLLTAFAALAIPVAIKVFSREESRSDEPIDFPGGLFLGALVAGSLFAITEGARSGWGSVPVVSAAAISALALVALVIRQRGAAFPFLPTELISNRRYVAVVSMRFTVMSANVAALIGLPLLLTGLHDLAISQVGFVLLPGAVLTALFGFLSGRMADKVGPRTPVLAGVALMLVAMVGLS